MAGQGAVELTAALTNVLPADAPQLAKLMHKLMHLSMKWKQFCPSGAWISPTGAWPVQEKTVLEKAFLEIDKVYEW